MPTKELSPIEIYKLLPGTNCMECGETNCMAFAAKLVNREATLEICTPILDEKNADSYAELWALLKPAVKAVEVGVGENAITIVNSLDHLQEHGALVFGAGGTSGSTFGFSAELNVTAMIDFLVKKTNAKILNQQTLWTKDNEEAMFFKGKRVAFFTTATTSATAGNVQNFEFQQVGMTLRVRPSITPENNVDMIINVILSQLTADKENNQPVRTEMDTTTNMIVKHSQTLMLGGILFQTDSQVERKIPDLGDVPVAGGLFRHNNIIASNEELIVFITPYVIDEPDNLLPETKAEIEPPLKKLETTKEELEALLGNSAEP